MQVPTTIEAMRRTQIGQHFEAISDYDTVIRLNPDDADAYNNRGVVKDNLGHPEAAIPDYDAAIHLNPNYANAYYNRGIAKEKLGRADDAKRDFQTALDLAEKAGDEELKSRIMESMKKLED